uniref:Leukotriene C4 synthase n=1 Tax=Neogobius melanostomus TaxID=47308 RepID=A0A8C6S7S4_9GOBI
MEPVFLGAVTILALLEQAYFSLQVIYARRKYSVSPPSTTGPDEFNRIYRAQANCAEYFPLFITALWTSGIFFSEGLSSLCGLLYLHGRLQYFWDTSQTPPCASRLAPLYFCANVLWALIGCSTLGVFLSFSKIYLDMDLCQTAIAALDLD